MILAQASPFWSSDAGSTQLYTKIALALLFGAVLIFALLKAPPRARGPITAAFVFVAGAFWVLSFLWPKPAFRGPNDVPDGFVDSVGFWISDATPIVNDFTNILVAFILGLGIFSLARVHFRRLFKMQKDWGFSLVLIIAMVSMIVCGYVEFAFKMNNTLEANQSNLFVIGKDFLFDGLLQEMEAGMFSVIAFYILSAAYRAFRIRSIESTILLCAALLMMLSLMGGLVFLVDKMFDGWTGQDPASFINNFRLGSIAAWVTDNIQSPSIRAMDFGIGLGALAMGLRLWLSLEKTGGTN